MGGSPEIPLDVLLLVFARALWPFIAAIGGLWLLYVIYKRGPKKFAAQFRDGLVAARAGRRMATNARAVEADQADRIEHGAIFLAHLLPRAHQQRYEDEWLSELQDLKDQGATRRHRADYVLGVALSVLRLRYELRGIPPIAAGSSSRPVVAEIPRPAVAKIPKDAFTGDLRQAQFDTAARQTFGTAVRQTIETSQRVTEDARRRSES